MTDKISDDVVQPITRLKSVRVQKQIERSEGDENVGGFLTKLLGMGSLKPLLLTTAVFLLAAFMSWQFWKYAQLKAVSNYGILIERWYWTSSTSQFFYTVFLGLGLVSFFVYLSRRF